MTVIEDEFSYSNLPEFYAAGWTNISESGSITFDFPSGGAYMVDFDDGTSSAERTDSRLLPLDYINDAILFSVSHGSSGSWTGSTGGATTTLQLRRTSDSFGIDAFITSSYVSGDDVSFLLGFTTYNPAGEGAYNGTTYVSESFADTGDLRLQYVDGTWKASITVSGLGLFTLDTLVTNSPSNCDFDTIRIKSELTASVTADIGYSRTTSMYVEGTEETGGGGGTRPYHIPNLTGSNGPQNTVFKHR
jgi:hypothetical protein